VFEILLAEDNPGDVLLFREALSSRQVQYNVVVAADGQRAIAVLGGENGPQWRPHLIVLDVNLPKYYGDAVRRHVRRPSSASPADHAVQAVLQTEHDRPT